MQTVSTNASCFSCFFIYFQTIGAKKRGKRNMAHLKKLSFRRASNSRVLLQADIVAKYNLIFKLLVARKITACDVAKPGCHLAWHLITVNREGWQKSHIVWRITIWGSVLLFHKFKGTICSMLIILVPILVVYSTTNIKWQMW